MTRPGAGTRHREAGMATAELAVAIPALVLVVAVFLGALGLGIDEIRCLDGAAAGARLAARGEPTAAVVAEASRLAPPGAAVSVVLSGERVTVSVRAAVPPVLRWIRTLAAPRASATAWLEDPTPEPAP